MSLVKTISYGPDAWKLLNGIFCVYKPSGVPTMHIRKTLLFNLCRDLNQLEQRETQSMVNLKGSVCVNKPFEIELVPNYADHELVSGPRYQEQDIRMSYFQKLGRRSSGVMLFTVNDGCVHAQHFPYKNFLRQYEIKGKFGIATQSFFADDIIRERSTYGHIKQHSFDRVLAAIQSSHNTLSFRYSGINPESQAGYEAAASGLIKPATKTDPLIYGIKCTEFKLPHFTLEVHCLNETDEFLGEIVHDIGVDLKSCAVCTQLRRVRYGPFTLSHALLRKHWTVEHILSNLTLCKRVLDDELKSDFRTIRQVTRKNIVEDMQNTVKEELLE